MSPPLNFLLLCLSRLAAGCIQTPSSLDDPTLHASSFMSAGTILFSDLVPSACAS